MTRIDSVKSFSLALWSVQVASIGFRLLSHRPLTPQPTGATNGTP